MRKITAIALLLVLTVSLAACRNRDTQPTDNTPAITDPLTVPTEPDMTMPSSNIPDPTVDSNSTEGTDGTDGTDSTDTTNPTNDTVGE